MQQVLKQSTAATTIVGPILDSTGAVYTGAVIGDLNITKNGTTAAMAAAATLTHDHNGHYLLVFTTGNTDTLGRLDVTCNKSTYAMPPKCFEVLSATTFDALVTNGTLASTTSGRTIVTDAAGLVDANMVKAGPTGAGTAQTARDIGASVLVSAGTGTGQLDITSGRIKADTVFWNASAVATPDTAGYPKVTIKNGTGTGELVIAGGLLSLSSSQAYNNSGTIDTVASIAASGITNASFAPDTGRKTIRSNTAQAGAAGTITLDASASAVTDFYKDEWVYLTGGTGASQARLVTAYNGSTKVATITPNWATNPDATSTFAVVPAAYVAGVQGNVSGSVGSVTGAVGSVTGGVTVTTNNDKTGYTLTQVFPSNFSSLGIGGTGKITGVVLCDTLTTYTGNTPQTGDNFARLGAPAGASVSADVAAVKADAAAVKTKTDSLTFTTAGKVDAKLTSDGLDNIATTAPTGVATTFREMVVQTWRRFFRKSTLTSTQLKTYADDGSTLVTTQTVSDDGTTQTQGTAS